MNNVTILVSFQTSGNTASVILQLLITILGENLALQETSHEKDNCKDLIRLD